MWERRCGGGDGWVGHEGSPHKTQLSEAKYGLQASVLAP